MFAVLTKVFADPPTLAKKIAEIRWNKIRWNISATSRWLFEQGIGLSVTFRLEPCSSEGESAGKSKDFSPENGKIQNQLIFCVEMWYFDKVYFTNAMVFTSPKLGEPPGEISSDLYRAW